MIYQDAHVTQHTIDGDKGAWNVRANKTEDLLLILPSTLKDNDVFTIFNKLREVERTSYSAGVLEQKELQAKELAFYKNELNNLRTLVQQQEI